MFNYRFSVDRQAAARALGAAIAFLLVASMLGQISRFEFGHDSVFGLVQLFDVNAEENIPTFFSMLLGLGNAVLLAAIGLGERHRPRKETVYWMALAFGFLFLAYDEGFQVHERLTQPMRSLMGSRGHGLFYFGWVVPGIAGVCAVGLMFVRFLLRMPADTRRWMLLSGAIYFGGAVGMELIDGKYVETHGSNLTYAFLTTIEEGMEMLGMSTLVFTLLGHIATYSGKIELGFSAARPARASVGQTEFG